MLKQKNSRHNLEFEEAPTRFELVMRVLQTRALPLGYGAIYNKMNRLTNSLYILNDPYGNRTRVTAVKGRCLDRLTNGPYYKVAKNY